MSTVAKKKGMMEAVKQVKINGETNQSAQIGFDERFILDWKTAYRGHK